MLASPLFSILGLGLVLLVLGLTIQRVDWLLQGSAALSLAIAATGLGLALGLGGEFVLGVSVIFATAAYTAAILTSTYHWSFWSAGLVAMLLATLVGVLLSLPGLRVSHFYFGMLGFFLVFLIPALVQMFDRWTAGSEGFSVLATPELFGKQLDLRGMFLFGVVALVVALLLSLNIRNSPLGIHVRRMRDSSVTLAASGIPVWRIRFATYFFSSLLAGLGGVVYSHLSGFLQPNEFTFEMTNMILAAVVIGGSRTLLGPCVGVIVLYIVPRVVIDVQGYTDIVYGALILISVIAFRGGVIQAVRDLVQWTRRHRSSPSADIPLAQTIARSPEHLADLIWSLRGEVTGDHRLVVRGIRKNYGGVRALDLEDEDEVVVESGQVHLLLGPNGSGKTTLLNAISGLARPDAGSVTLDGVDVTGGRVAKIASMGIGRSFQGPALPDEVTPVELFTAALAQRMGVSYAHWLIADPVAHRARKRATEGAMALAEAAGLGRAGTEECERLTSGQRRVVDVVHALVATRSSIVLLDEPAAGLSDPERRQLAATIRALANRGLGFIVVEHDLDLALSLADTVTVMATGRPVAQGSPDHVKSSSIVKEVLIGASA
jgi:ABC-type branched-subunit amino acid transport system ATPase component/ABC-type branched-subunit amino acid transport system permease subunit